MTDTIEASALGHNNNYIEVSHIVIACTGALII